MFDLFIIPLLRINQNDMWLDKTKIASHEPLDSEWWWERYIDGKYIDSITEKSTRFDHWWHGHDGLWCISTPTFRRIMVKFVGKNIDELHKYISKKYGRRCVSSYELIMDHVAVKNKNGDIINKYGSILPEKNIFSWAVGDDGIIVECKKDHQYKTVEKPSKFDALQKEYFDIKDSISNKKEALSFNFGSSGMWVYYDYKEEKGRLLEIEMEWSKLWNFYYKRDVRDKVDRFIKPVVLPKIRQKLRSKTRSKRKDKIVLEKPKSLLKSTAFNNLTGLR